MCQKMFPSIGTVKHHRNIIHFPKILICRWNCGLTFNGHGPRIKHEKIKHYENKPLERICDICEKPCTTEVALGNHKKTHLNPCERANEHKCSICTEICQSMPKLSHHRKLEESLLILDMKMIYSTFLNQKTCLMDGNNWLVLKDVNFM